MATQDLRFNIFGNDRASAAFARVSAAADALAGRLTVLDNKRVKINIEARVERVNAQIQAVEARLTRLQAMRPSVEIDADIATARAKIEALQNELRDLNNGNARIDIDIRQAEGRLTTLRRELIDLEAQEYSPEVSLEIGAVRRDIAEVETLLQSLGDEGVEIDAHTERARRETADLEAETQHLAGLRADVNVDADIKKAEAKLAALRVQLANLNGRLDIDVDHHGFLGTLNLMRRGLQDNINSAAQLSRNLRQLALPVSFAGALPTLASLGASLQAMSGAISLLPAGALFAAASITTLAVGFNGLADAIGPRDTAKQIEKADLAMSRLGVNARQTAKAVVELKPAWNSLKQVVQNELFEGIGLTLKKLGETYIPVLKHGLGGMADAFNANARQMATFLQTAGSVDDTRVMFDLFSQTVTKMGPGFVNITAAMQDLGVVGGSFLPALGQGFTNLTEKFANFINTAREDGSLELWIAQGITAIEEFGDLLGNIGGIFGAVFEASEKSGASFITTMKLMTGELESFLKSAQGQTGLMSLFSGIHEFVGAALPGLRVFFGAIADGLAALRVSFGPVGEAFTAFSQALAPTIVMLAELASDVLVPLAYGFIAVSNAIGPLVPTVLTLAIAFKALTGLGALFATAGAAVAGFSANVALATATMTGSAAATNAAERAMLGVGGAISKVGAALPLIGIALIGLTLAWDHFGTKAEEKAESVANGTMTLKAAIQEAADAIDANGIDWLGGADAIQAYEMAQREVTDALYAHMATLGPLEKAQALVNIAEANYNEIATESGANSREAKTAADVLKTSKEGLVEATRKHTDATRTDTEALLENTNVARDAANADAALERANLALERQQKTTTDTIKKYGASSVEGRDATLSLRESMLGAAEAAGRKAEADAKATGATDAAEQGARVYQQRLIELAGQAKGPTRDALLETIRNFDGTRDGTNKAAIAAAGLTEEIGRIPNKTVTVTAEGKLGPVVDVNAVRATGGQYDYYGHRLATGGVIGDPGRGMPVTRRADGGVLPGYTPGSDVHRFVGAAGSLELSGGEAIMRPEWTRAVTPAWVHAANAAARQGGIGGVQSFLARTAPRGGPEGMRGDGSRFAAGGILGIGINRADAAAEAMAQKMAPLEAAKIRAAIAAMIASGSGPVTAGAAAGLAWARTQVGKPYIWGAVGPGGYDCSGFMSAIVNVMRGRNPHSRVGATGNFPWAGFLPGIGAGLNIGAFKGDPGHMAGTIGGVNVESSGSVGVRVGGGARGAGDSMFTTRAHLFDRGGVAMNSGLIAKLTNRPERVLSPRQTETFDRFTSALERRSPLVGGGSSADLSALRGDVQNLGDSIRAGIRAARTITVEDKSGNPVETARATSLVMRL